MQYLSRHFLIEAAIVEVSVPVQTMDLSTATRMSKRRMWTSRTSTTTPKVNIGHCFRGWLTRDSIWPTVPLTCHMRVVNVLNDDAGLLEGEPQEALKGFKEVISMEGERGEWWVP